MTDKNFMGNSMKITIEMTRLQALQHGLLTCKHCGYPDHNHFSFGKKKCAHEKNCPGYEDAASVGKLVNPMEVDASFSND